MAKGKKHYAEELKEMINQKAPNEPVDEVLVTFCGRHGISMEECKKYYDRLVADGTIKEE
jgi:predicted solute-binding protein